MSIQIEIAELGPKFEELVDELAHNGGEANLTREGKAVGTLHIDSIPATREPPTEGRVFYNGRWMIPAAAERERSIEHLRGSGKVLGDIVSPIYDGPLAGSVIDEGDVISPIEAEWESAK
jgi:hypothetical protein